MSASRSFESVQVGSGTKDKNIQMLSQADRGAARNKKKEGAGLGDIAPFKSTLTEGKDGLKFVSFFGLPGYINFAAFTAALGNGRDLG